MNATMLSVCYLYIFHLIVNILVILTYRDVFIIIIRKSVLIVNIDNMFLNQNLFRSLSNVIQRIYKASVRRNLEK
jgi:flagellar biosynthesis protein FliR